MALIEEIISGSKEGCIYIKDNKRKYPVSLCSDATKDLIYYLKQTKKPENRIRFEKLLPNLRSPMSRYILKLAIDNGSRSKEIINEIQNAIIFANK